MSDRCCVPGCKEIVRTRDLDAQRKWCLDHTPDSIVSAREKEDTRAFNRFVTDAENNGGDRMHSWRHLAYQAFRLGVKRGMGE